jgi:hypothetical protein
MRGECIVVRDGQICGKPSVFSVACDCVMCQSVRESNGQVGAHYCAEHYDELMALRCRFCGEKHSQCDCPEEDQDFED